MIFFSAFFSDFITHSAVLILLSAYFRYLLTTKDNTFIWIAIVAALIISFINHQYYPYLRLSIYPPSRQIVEGGSGSS
jgi:hypothetical protein